ncbi:hypothetical protein PTKIN_Ptkin07bG0275300 [Pterospermum kingtungense]
MPWIRQFIEDFNNAQSTPLKSLQHDRAKWEPPAPNMFKVNFDGLFHSPTKAGGIGVVIRNGARELMGTKVAKIQNVIDPFVIKATAAIQAMEFARDLGFQRILLEGDALSIVSKLKSSSLDLFVIGFLIKEGREIAKLFQLCKIQHTPRSGNTVAHTLAKMGLEIEALNEGNSLHDQVILWAYPNM